MYQPQHRGGKKHHQKGKHRGKTAAGKQGSADLPRQGIIILRPVLGAHQHACPHTHSAYQQNGYVHNGSGGSHCRQRLLPQNLTHNDGIRRIVCELKQIAQYQRNRKGYQGRDDLPLGHIVFSPFMCAHFNNCPFTSVL